MFVVDLLRRSKLSLYKTLFIPNKKYYPLNERCERLHQQINKKVILNLHRNGIEFYEWRKKKSYNITRMLLSQLKALSHFPISLRNL